MILWLTNLLQTGKNCDLRNNRNCYNCVTALKSPPIYSVQLGLGLGWDFQTWPKTVDTLGIRLSIDFAIFYQIAVYKTVQRATLDKSQCFCTYKNRENIDSFFIVSSLKKILKKYWNFYYFIQNLQNIVKCFKYFYWFLSKIT